MIEGLAMRRRLDLYLPIVLIAMWMQLIAPIASFGVLAQAVSNPLLMSDLCRGVSSHDETQSAPANTQDDVAACCAICSIGHGGNLVLDPPAPVFVTLQLDYRKLSWRDAVAPAHRVAARSHAQARAPPFLS